jgi:hypothetical protein
VSEFDLKSAGGERLETDQLEEIILWHRGYGLRLAFQGSEAAVTLDGLHGQLVSEILRLARLGMKVQAAAAHPGFEQYMGERGLAKLWVADADTEWKLRFS